MSNHFAFSNCEVTFRLEADPDVLNLLKSIKEILMAQQDKLDEMTAEIAETKAAIGPLVEALRTAQAANVTLQQTLADALAAANGQATDDAIQLAIDNLNQAQADIAAALEAAPEVPPTP